MEQNDLVWQRKRGSLLEVLLIRIKIDRIDSVGTASCFVAIYFKAGYPVDVLSPDSIQKNFSSLPYNVAPKNRANTSHPRNSRGRRHTNIPFDIGSICRRSSWWCGLWKGRLSYRSWSSKLKSQLWGQGSVWWRRCTNILAAPGHRQSSRITFQIELWSWQLKSEIVESSWSDDGQFDRRALRKLLSLERLKDSSWECRRVAEPKRFWNVLVFCFLLLIVC